RRCLARQAVVGSGEESDGEGEGEHEGTSGATVRRYDGTPTRATGPGERRRCERREHDGGRGDEAPVIVLAGRGDTREGMVDVTDHPVNGTRVNSGGSG